MSEVKSGMQRISFEDFQRRVESAEQARPVLKTDPKKHKTRIGCYWTIIRGMSVSTWFVGVATDEDNAFIIENVS